MKPLQRLRTIVTTDSRNSLSQFAGRAALVLAWFSNVCTGGSANGRVLAVDTHVRTFTHGVDLVAALTDLRIPRQA